ncbi:hypothetical protein [Methanobacterium sp.]|uniref:hypothetical protein n=1 Tax=Methanobacterium sp. TaxID=2164 RepID=UPI00315986F4
MNDREFNTLEKIRKCLKSKRDRIDELEDEIKQCRQKEHEQLAPMREELADTKDEWYNDPDKRTEYGIKKQSEWKLEIEKILAPAQNKIDDITTDYEIKREKRYTEIRELKKQIKDLEMEHANKLAYYSQPNMQKVSIDFNVKDVQQEVK